LDVGEDVVLEIRSPISGYLHLIHVDANGLVETMFPCKGAKIRTVRGRSVVRCPSGVLKEGFRWRVGKTRGKTEGRQQIAGLVTRSDVEVEKSDLDVFGIRIDARGISLAMPTLTTAKPSWIAHGKCEYWMRNNKPRQRRTGN